MPTRKYKRYKKKTVKRRKNKGGGGNFSRPNPPLTQITPPSKKKRVTFPKDDDLFTIKEISPRTIKNDADDDKIEEDEKKKCKTKKKKWTKVNAKLQTKGKTEISFNDYTKKLKRKQYEEEEEEEKKEKKEIDKYLADQKNSIPRKNKLTPLTMDEQLVLDMEEYMKNKV
jgi:hypothetical protein